LTSIFIVLSGEHPTLPLAEVDSILASEGLESRQLATHGNVAIVESEEKIYPILKHRSAMVLAAGKLLFTAKPSKHSILLASAKSASRLGKSRSICVRVRRFRGAHPELGRSKLEREIGSAMLSKAKKKLKIELRHPDTTLLGIITDDAFILGFLRVTIDRGAYDKRRPRTRPYFKPGVLAPRIARVFVNLSQLNSSKTFYDPFVGTGGFLIEACSVGRYALGSDADLRMVSGARDNLRHYDFANFDLFLSDAAKIPLRQIDCVGFDPPYGRATSTRKKLTKDLIQSSLTEIAQIIPRKGYTTLAFPSNLEMEHELPPGKFSVVERHSMRVHRSLTRSILVLKRT
jgi:tRNA (guanine10-N2)-dimethyltransferase